MNLKNGLHMWRHVQSYTVLAAAHSYHGNIPLQGNRLQLSPAHVNDYIQRCTKLPSFLQLSFDFGFCSYPSPLLRARALVCVRVSSWLRGHRSTRRGQRSYTTAIWRTGFFGAFLLHHSWPCVAERRSLAIPPLRELRLSQLS